MAAEFRLTKAELLALCEFTHKDVVRMHLSAVCFDYGRGECTASDGTMLAQYRPEEKPDGQTKVAVQRETLLRLSKSMDAQSTLVVSANDSEVTLRITGPLALSFWCTTTIPRDASTSERMPPYHEVIPPTERHENPAPVFALDPSKLAKVGAVQRATGRHRAVDIYAPKDRNSPILFRIDGDARWVVVIMPMRSQATESTDQKVAAE